MADVLPGDGIRVGRLVRFGYAEMTAKADSMLFCAGETLPIHEFHHWDSTANGTAFTACKTKKCSGNAALQTRISMRGSRIYTGGHAPAGPLCARGRTIQQNKRMTKMTETELNALLAGITPANEAARAAAHAHWASLAKPLGGLGRLETMLEDAAALTGSAELDLSRRVVVVLCADNGVVAQGVSQTGREVTRAVAENLAMRRTSVCQMARTAHCDVLPVDMGMAGEPVPGVRNCRVAAGTADFTLGHAMTREQAVQAVGEGISLARELAEGWLQAHRHR